MPGDVLSEFQVEYGLQKISEVHYLFARHLGRRADWIGKCGPALNFGRGIVHLELGIGNFIAVGHDQNPNTLDLHVPKDSSYTAPRWWGKS